MADANIYDEVEIEDMDFNEEERAFFYPCPCGDRFRITIEQLVGGGQIAECPSCSLQIRVISDENYVRENFGKFVEVSV